MRYRRDIDRPLSARDFDDPSTVQADIEFGDLAEWHCLVCKCGACGRQAALDRYALVRQFGQRSPIKAVYPSLRCKACGNREGNRILVGKQSR